MSCANRLLWDARRGPSISQAVVWKRARAASGCPGVSGTPGRSAGLAGDANRQPRLVCSPGRSLVGAACQLALSPPRVSARPLPAPAAGLEPGSRGAGAAPGRSPPRRREQLLPGARIRLGARGAAGPGPPRRLPAPRAPRSGRNVTVVPPRPGAPSSAPRAADLSGLSRAPILACPRSGARSGRRRKSRC